MPISSPGIGSGLNVNDIVTKLMALEGQGLTRLQTQQSKVDNQISAIGKIKSASGDILIGDGAGGPVTAAIKAKLVGIQRGEIADEFGWVRRIG